MFMIIKLRNQTIKLILWLQLMLKFPIDKNSGISLNNVNQNKIKNYQIKKTSIFNYWKILLFSIDFLIVFKAIICVLDIFSPIMYHKRNENFYSHSSLNQSKEKSLENPKKYRCDCCGDKKYHDYNREKRLKRESASSKRLNFTARESPCSVFKENKLNLPNTEVICSIDNYEVKVKNDSSRKVLPAIIQSPHLCEQNKKKDKSSRKNSPQNKKKDKSSRKNSPLIDMKSYCKNLFSGGKKIKPKNHIEVRLNCDVYLIELDSNEKMKLALGELKLLIASSQNKCAKFREK